MPFDLEDCFRKGDVGGERGFDAALAFLNFAEAESRLDGDSKNVIAPIHNSTMTTTVSGLIRRNRIGPIVILMWAILCRSSCNLFTNMCQTQGEGRTVM